MSTIFRLDQEMANALIVYLQAKGLNARIYITEGLRGMDGSEELEAMTKPCCPQGPITAYGWSTAMFGALSQREAFKLIDKQFPEKSSPKRRTKPKSRHDPMGSALYPVDQVSMKCPECENQGQTPERIDVLSSMKSLAFNPPFYDEKGVKVTHDTNSTTEKLRCSNGHVFTKVTPPGNTSITRNANAPSNTTVRVDACIPRLDAMWEIIKELSESNASASVGGHERCIFCQAKGDYISNLRHDPTCIVAKAYELVWEMESKKA